MSSMQLCVSVTKISRTILLEIGCGGGGSLGCSEKREGKILVNSPLDHRTGTKLCHVYVCFNIR